MSHVATRVQPFDPNAVRQLCRPWVAERGAADAGHDLSHIERVVANATRLAQAEQARLDIVLPAAWLHDCVAVAKDSPDRARASGLAAEAAVEFLSANGYAPHLLPDIAHAIEAHSYSAGIPTRSLEARVVQDADRLDALGAIGIARCMMVGGKLDRPLYDPEDPFCRRREPDDRRFGLDHFYTKLLKLPATMQTDSGRRVAAERVRVMEGFLSELEGEIES